MDKRTNSPEQSSCSVATVPVCITEFGSLQLKSPVEPSKITHATGDPDNLGNELGVSAMTRGRQQLVTLAVGRGLGNWGRKK